MSDDQLKQLMKQLSSVIGLNLTDDRIERDLVAYKSQLAAIDRIKTVALPVEAEPFRHAGGSRRLAPR